jgi:copper chaperone NosL
MKANITQPLQRLITLLVVSFLMSSLLSCSENNQQIMLKKAVTIESSDECHLCGMMIKEFAGPKGELYKKGAGTVEKFCSTRDMFSYYLDPENKRNVAQLFVHDMSKTPWDSPNDSYFIDAKKAWYVAGSQKTGAMGKTLASFAKKEDALAFTEKFGGKVLSFDQITIDVLL